ncbi:MAG: phenylalanine--tRNA ligase subunit beta [Thiobacillaceae bacterium]
MQFSERWLRSLVQTDLTLEDLAQRLTMAGLELEAVVPVAPAFDRVVVAEILRAERHPNADRLQLCEVSAGSGEPLRIVCGAPNARPGLKTACALVGAVLPGGLEIRQAKVRGVDSYGMLCSASELGLDQDAAGILELPADAPVGADLRDYLHLDDRLISLKLTPNRGDCLSLQGIAREVAALTGGHRHEVDCSPVPATVAAPYPVRVEAGEACPRYCGRVVRAIDPSAQTPAWMAERLTRSGLRLIHPVVDITNYVLLELGQPMHAFDLARLQGPLRARWAEAGERLLLLNAAEITLEPDCLVIADDGGPLALAGIMGGISSAVDTATRDIFLEAAHFTPAAVAGRARRYGLATDASQRFERGVDPMLPRRALERATRLILEVCGGEAGEVIEAGPGVPARSALAFRPERARRLLGVEIPMDEMQGIFARLGLDVDTADTSWRVKPPSWRFDLNREVDLIEELARLWGYERIPESAPAAPQHMLPAGEGERTIDEVKNLLVAIGYQEIITYSFISSEQYGDFKKEHDALTLLNPIASQMNVMRASLLPGLVQTLRHNLNHGQERLRLFEAGRCFLGATAEAQPQRVAGLAYGPAQPEQWAVPTRPVDFYDVKADVAALFWPRQPEFVAAVHPALHPGQTARIRIDGREVGWLGSLHPRLAQKYELARSPILFELEAEALTRRTLPRYGGLSRYPAVRRDVAVVVDASLEVGGILAAVRAALPRTITEFELFDVYQGQGIESGKKSLAFRMLLQHTEKTLTDAEIEAAVSEVLAVLTERFNAVLRA